MNPLLGGVLLALKSIGILLLVLIVLVGVLLLLPVGLQVRWTEKEGPVCRLLAGPLRLPLYPPPEKKKAKTKKKKRRPQKPPAPKAQAGESEPAPSGPPPAGAQGVPAPKADPGAPARTQPSADGLLAAMGTLGRALWPRRERLLRRIEVRRLQVVWTVTGADAADTAITYGRRIALFNTLLAMARDHVRIRADELRLEPDFTGKQKENRRLACQIVGRTYIIVVILWTLLQKNENGEIPLQKMLGQLSA